MQLGIARLGAVLRKRRGRREGVWRLELGKSELRERWERKKKLNMANSAKHTSLSNEDVAHQHQDRCGSEKLNSLYIGDTKRVMQAEMTVTLENVQKTERDNQTKLNSEMDDADCNTQSDTKKDYSL
ncbi:hypothetical protein GUJ93_ZPchr0009g622 [Zizania palustris]|uniref:Uncharacterized protein n=1 Tax=Zizania palustris TaxID=103762 RepID=A0A8J5R133_ZIZPA|nr:hypothetical protein GUJ93_ZPchr0009g622 [Zizania palustris]